MKFPSFFVALTLASQLLVPGLALAQPAAPPQPNPAAPPDPRAAANAMAPLMFVFNEDNRRGVAMMGAFYNSIETAKTYQGHFVLTQTSTKDGQVTQVKTLDWESTWQRDGETESRKVSSDGSYTVTQDGKTTVEPVSGIDDGEKSYRYYGARDTWTERPQSKTSSPDYSTIATFLPWITTMMRVPAASNLKLEKRADGTAKVASLDGAYEAVYNTDGTLQNWKSSGKDGTIELRFDRLRLNAAVDADTFKWQIPQGAKRVDDDKEGVKIEFNFNF